MRSASAGQTASFTLVTDPDGEEEDEDDDEDDDDDRRAPAPPGNGPLAAPAVAGINGEAVVASAAQAGAGVPSNDGGSPGSVGGALGAAAPALGGSPLLYEGGGCSPVGGAAVAAAEGVGDGESPSKRTRKGMVLVEVREALFCIDGWRGCVYLDGKGEDAAFFLAKVEGERCCGKRRRVRFVSMMLPRLVPLPLLLLSLQQANPTPGVPFFSSSLIGHHRWPSEHELRVRGGGHDPPPPRVRRGRRAVSLP